MTDRADEPVDVRLVPAAAAVWSTAGCAVLLPAGPALAAGVLALGTALGAALGTALAVVLRGARPTPWRGQAVLVLGAVGVLLLTTGAQIRAREGGDLRALAADGARVRLVGVVRSTPRAVGRGSEASAGSDVRFLLVAGAVEVLGAAGPVRTGAAVEVLAPPESAGLVYGTEVELVARVVPARDRADRAVVRARATGPPEQRGPPPTLLRGAERIRAGLVRTASAVPGDAGRLLPAVAVGDVRGVGDLDDAMRASGLAHLTAVSGAHFSLLGAVTLVLAARCRVSRRLRWLPVALVTSGFVLVVQPGASVVRAAVMGAVGVLGLVAGRPARTVPALACAVLVLLVVDPWLARDLGFVLSVVATAGIALLAAPLARRWSTDAAPGRGAAPETAAPAPSATPGPRAASVPGPPVAAEPTPASVRILASVRLVAAEPTPAPVRPPAPARPPASGRTAVPEPSVVPGWMAAPEWIVVPVRLVASVRLVAPAPLASAVAVPVAAQAVCAPVVLLLSPTVPTYAVAANLVVAPAVAPATVGGLLAALLAPWWSAGATWCAQVAGAGCWWIARVARTAAALPGGQVPWVGGPAGPVLLACASGAALVLALRCRRGVAP